MMRRCGRHGTRRRSRWRRPCRLRRLSDTSRPPQLCGTRPGSANPWITTYSWATRPPTPSFIFAGVAKKACGGKSLVGTYYGYLTQHGRRQQDSSHLALAKVLRCPDVDFLMSPPLYTDRQLCGTSGFMSATESVRLHGKLWLSEADYRTHLSSQDSGYGRTGTPDESRAGLLREMGNVLSAGRPCRGTTWRATGSDHRSCWPTCAGCATFRSSRWPIGGLFHGDVAVFG